VVTRVCVSVCLSVCVSVCSRTPTLLHGPGCNLGHGRGCPLVVHLWADLQSVHGLRCYGNNANPSYKLASIPRYDDTVRTLGGVCTRCWRVPGAFSKLRSVYGKWASLAGRRQGAFSTLLQRPGLRASTRSVLAT